MKDISPKLTEFLFKAIIFLSLAVSFYLLYYHIFPALNQIGGFLLPALTPFILGIFLAAIIDPLVNFLEFGGRVQRGIAVALSMVLVIGLVGLLMFLAISQLVTELASFYTSLPEYAQVINSQVRLWVEEAENFYLQINLPLEISSSISGIVSSLVRDLRQLTTAVINYLLGFFASIPSLLLIALFALLATFFFSRDKGVISQRWFGMLSPPTAEKCRGIYRDVVGALLGLLRAQLILMGITAILTILGLYLLRVEYALTMGVIVGIVDALPVLGPGAVFVPWIIWLVSTGKVGLAVGLGILYGFVTVTRQLIQPKIIGDCIGLNPLSALISMFVGLKIFGVWGVAIGPILLVIGNTLYRAGIFSWKGRFF
jgi:sporulation integral membrane protein YtvI